MKTKVENGIIEHIGIMGIIGKSGDLSCIGTKDVEFTSHAKADQAVADLETVEVVTDAFERDWGEPGCRA
jgi:hypothetical protein